MTLPPQIHPIQTAAEFEHEGFRLRVLHFETCGDPDCDCIELGDEVYRAFGAPYLGRTDEWLSLGNSTAEDGVDPLIQELADSISSDVETPPTILDRSAALFGVSWELVTASPITVIHAQAKAIDRIDADRAGIIARTSIGELRKIKQQTHGRRIEREVRSR